MKILPTPTGPMIITLWPASMKRSEQSSSQTWWSGCGAHPGNAVIEFEKMSVGVVEVDAATAEAAVDLTGLAPHRVGEGGNAQLLQTRVAGVEGRLVDQERDVHRLHVDRIGEIERDAADLQRLEVRDDCGPGLDAENLAQEPRRSNSVLGRNDHVVDLDAHDPSLFDAQAIRTPLISKLLVIDADSVRC